MWVKGLLRFLGGAKALAPDQPLLLNLLSINSCGRLEKEVVQAVRNQARAHDRRMLWVMAKSNTTERAF